MWESLATTRRQDSVLHGAAKIAQHLRRGLSRCPLWLLGQRLSGPLRRAGRRACDAEPGPLPVPQPRERSMDALMADLEAIPHKLQPLARAELRKGPRRHGPFVLAQHRETANLGYAYPAQFRTTCFEGADGVRIAATVALHECPSARAWSSSTASSSSRRFDYVREIAVTAYYDWGFNVAAIDLRSFGLTDLISQAPRPAGWKEGEDIVAAGR